MAGDLNSGGHFGMVGVLEEWATLRELQKQLLEHFCVWEAFAEQLMFVSYEAKPGTCPGLQRLRHQMLIYLSFWAPEVCGGGKGGRGVYRARSFTVRPIPLPFLWDQGFHTCFSAG